MTLQRITKKLLAILLALGVLLPASTAYQRAQSNATSAEIDKAQLYQALLDLSNPWTVLCVAAHPDDEDGSTLTVLRRKYGVHTVSLFSTYGEGGQNAVGPELYEELGVIRARETMAAAEVQGSEPNFLGMRDFGFSKSAEETFRNWGEREALRRMVLKIRQLRPDVIITNHDTTSGHGHHQATGRLILQAFDAAADPKQFPEQLNEVTTWQPQRLFVRGFRNPSSGAQQPANNQQIVTVDPNEIDAVRGISYAQQALNGLQKHATQGPWPKTVPPNGARIIRYTLVRQVSSAAPLPADAKTVIDGLRLPETISKSFAAPTIDNKPLTSFVDNRGEVLVSLVNARKHGAFTSTKEVESIDPQRFQLMSRRLDHALATVAGVQLSLKSDDRVLVPGTKSQFEISVSNSGDADVSITKLDTHGFRLDKPVDPPEKLLPGTETSQQVVATIPTTAKISVPSAEHLYDGRLFGEPFSATADVSLEGAKFSVSAERKTDVAPPVEIVDNNPVPCVETPATVGHCSMVSVTLVNNLKSKFTGQVALKSESPSVVRGHTSRSVASQVAGTDSSVDLALEPQAQQKVVLGNTANLSSGGTQRSGSKVEPTVISVVDNGSKQVVSQETIPVVYVAGVAIAGLKVGYVPSTDQTLKHSLSALGVQATELSVKDVQQSDLSRFDTIIIDNRGYETHHELISANDRLLKYVESGGTLIVFYHKTNEWNPDERAKRPQLAPYSIVLSDDRVTEEDAPIEILEPRHPLLNFPNRITQQDFTGWIQERGLYFPRTWDEHYTAVLSTHDKGEAPLKGGLLVGGYGKGNYIYTSIVWYRQLRAGIPGGYRFFANMISYGHKSTGNAD